MKPITDAADGFDEVAGVTKLLPQAFNVNVDGALEDDCILTDGRVHELESGKGPAGLAEHDLEQAKLGRREQQFGFSVERAVAVAVNDDALALDERRQKRPRPSSGVGAALS